MVDHQDMIIDGAPDTIANFRSGLVFGKPRNWSKRSVWIGDSSELIQTRLLFKGTLEKDSLESTSLSSGRGVRSSSVASSLSRKHKFVAMLYESRLSNLGSSWGHSLELREVKKAKCLVHEQESACKLEVQEAQLDNNLLLTENDEPYDKRAHCCLVISPAGRPIHDFR